MFTRTQRHLVALTLLTVTTPVAAQDWAESTTPETPGEYERPASWPKPPDATLQTYIGIRHNAADGTVVGMGLRPPGYPSVLVELEVVPPGYGPSLQPDQASPPPVAPDQPILQTVHKLSLRFRF